MSGAAFILRVGYFSSPPRWVAFFSLDRDMHPKKVLIVQEQWSFSTS